MKNWLDKYEQGGMVLKQKTKDNYGEKPNPNNPDVSLPPGFKGWAYNTKGRNYSPAWGGQFQNGGNLMPAMAGANQTVPMMQMGGSLPGATGMMYARTINPAPSNGPYAKKTKASAQKGKAITKREDFEPWWNWASKKAGDVEARQDAYAGGLGDLYAYYSGQPLHYNVLEYSQYKPTNAKDPNAKYISINNPKFKQEVFDKYTDVFINKQLQSPPLLKETKINDSTYAVSGYRKRNPKELKKTNENLHAKYVKDVRGSHASQAIGRYFLSKGKDEKGDYISYYDVFDEGSGPNGGGIGETLGLTKPFEIYDRIYLDPKTGKPKLQNGGEMKYYQEGLDFKPKTISQDGSEIPVDSMGYWNPDNWGNPVTIPSNMITMEGVDQPLVGISDTGDTQMMYPGEDYTFDGESVTEYPVMQKGGRVPIYVDNPNDKKLRAYQDSLAAYKTNIWPEHNEPIKKYSVPKETYKIVGKDKDGKDVWGLRPYKPTNMEPAYQYDYIDNSQVGKESIFEKIGKTKAGNFATMLLYKKPVQPVEYRKPKGDQFGLTKEDYIQAQKSKFVRTPDSKLGDGYYDFKKDGKSYKVYTQSGGINWVDVPQTKPKQVAKPEPKKEEPVKKTEQAKPVEKKQNVYEGSPVYSPGAGSGLPSALIGFLNQKGDTTFIKPEDYERFAVPKYGKEFIESKKKQRNGGWLDKWK